MSMAGLLPDREQKAEYRAPRVQASLADFVLERRLGEGSFAQVVQVQHRGSGGHYALKVVDKHLVLRHGQAAAVRSERALLDRLDHAGIVRLHFTFQDASNLYLGLDLCPNGAAPRCRTLHALRELYDQIHRRGALPPCDARVYAAEVVLVLEYLRQQQVVHRDLKPENLLLDERGHLKLTDFGSAKDLSPARAAAAPPQQPVASAEAAEVHGKEEADAQHSRRTCSMVGTADYVAPEVLRNEPVSYAADLWALGCVLYQMLLGRPPFRGASEYLTFQRILARDLALPESLLPPTRDLLSRLLAADPSERLGAGAEGLAELKRHPFFEGIDWAQLRSQEAPALAPPPAQAEDSGFDWEWSSLAAALPVHYSYDENAESAAFQPSSTRGEGAEGANTAASLLRKADSSPAAGASDSRPAAAASEGKPRAHSAMAQSASKQEAAAHRKPEEQHQSCAAAAAHSLPVQHSSSHAKRPEPASSSPRSPSRLHSHVASPFSAATQHPITASLKARGTEAGTGWGT